MGSEHKEADALERMSHISEISLFKLTFTIALWVAYLTVLLLRAINKLYGTRLAWTCLALFVAALFILWPVEASRDHSRLTPVVSQILPPDNAD